MFCKLKLILYRAFHFGFKLNTPRFFQSLYGWIVLHAQIAVNHTYLDFQFAMISSMFIMILMFACWEYCFNHSMLILIYNVACSDLYGLFHVHIDFELHVLMWCLHFNIDFWFCTQKLLSIILCKLTINYFLFILMLSFICWGYHQSFMFILILSFTSWWLLSISMFILIFCFTCWGDYHFLYVQIDFKLDMVRLLLSLVCSFKDWNSYFMFALDDEKH